MVSIKKKGYQYPKKNMFFWRNAHSSKNASNFLPPTHERRQWQYSGVMSHYQPQTMHCDMPECLKITIDLYCLIHPKWVPFVCFQKKWYPQIIHFNEVFHHKPSILGYPYFWKHPFNEPLICVIQKKIPSIGRCQPRRFDTTSIIWRHLAIVNKNYTLEKLTCGTPKWSWLVVSTHLKHISQIGNLPR